MNDHSPVGDRPSLRLNVGSGLDLLPGFVNLDNSIYLRLSWLSGVGQLIFGRQKAAYLQRARSGVREGSLRMYDCRKALPFSGGSVDHVLASHILEHLYPDQAEATLREVFRVLRPAGTLHVIVPDLKRLVERYLSNEKGSAADEFITNTIMSHRTRPSLRYRLLELIGYEGLQHRWMYDHESMSGMMMKIGFEILSDHETPSSFVRRSCPDSVHILGRKPLSTASIADQPQQVVAGPVIGRSA